MSPFTDLQTCAEHGFTLTPEGICLRCRNEAARVAQRARAVKVASGAAFAVTLLGFTAAWASMHPHAQAAASPSARNTDIVFSDRPTTERSPVSEPEPTPPPPPATEPVTSPATHAALAAWELELARADAKRSAEAAAESAAKAAAASERIANAQTTYTTTSVRTQGRVESGPSSTTDHPSWWQDPQPIVVGGRRHGGYGAYGAGTAAGGTVGAYGLPPNNGGNFRNRSAASH